jgi:hypothetical protein
MGELNTGSQNASDFYNFTFEAFEIDDPEVLVGRDINVKMIQFGSVNDEYLKETNNQGKSPEIFVELGDKNVLIGANGRDRFVLGRADEVGDVEINLPEKNGEKVVDDKAEDDDYASIEKFDPQQDFIEPIGSNSDYTLEASPNTLEDGISIFQGEKLIRIVEGKNKLDLDTYYFEFSL